MSLVEPRLADCWTCTVCQQAFPRLCNSLRRPQKSNASPLRKTSLFPHRPAQPQRLRAHSTVLRALSRGQVMTPRASADQNSIKPPYNVVITGSTKGIGRALAVEFLKAGDSVVISSRSDDRVRSTVRELAQVASSKDQVKGCACNVAKASEVAALAQYAASELGHVDIWINNAGTNAYRHTTLLEANDADIVSIVETNVVGVMLCCREAIRLMGKQPGGGLIFNMEGAGADGNPTPLYAAYGATKRGLAQLGKSLRAELKMQGISGVDICTLSPGMVTTELLMAGVNTRVAKFFVNCLAEPAEVVAQVLVPRIRRAPQEGRGPLGSQAIDIRFLTKPKAYGQIALRFLLGQRKNRFLKEE